jgi:acyl-coenzyme A synthetase/AMP-(fatty) acid ligase
MLRRRRKTATILHAGPYPQGWEVPARFNFTRDVIEPLGRRQRRAGLTFVDREGIVDRRSFAEVAGDAARWAHLLRTRLERGERVLVYTGKVPAWHGAMLGALKGGLISVPCSEMLRARDLAFRVRHSGAGLVIADRAGEVEVEEMLEQLETPVPVLYLDEARAELARYVDRAPTEDTTAGERAFILYTSGTTKDPRGVVHTHAYTWALRSQAEHWLGVHEQDVVWCTAGTGWAKSIWNVLIGPWSHGAEVVLHQGGFDPDDRLSLMERLGVSVLCQAPTEYRMLAKLDTLAAAHLPRLRHAVSAGEPLNPEVIERFQDALGITVHDGYGQTENSLLVANAPGMEIRPGSMGLPTPGHDVAVIDEYAQVCGPGVEGDIALFGRPPTLFAGYWEARDESEAVFRDDWYVTGDRGVQDDEGYLWFVGRADDVILSSAYRIGPFEVESALLEHPAVAESAVVGAPDPDRGEIVKAFVVLRPGTDPTSELVQELQEHVKTVTAPYKYPREVAFVDELPKTTSG